MQTLCVKTGYKGWKTWRGRHLALGLRIKRVPLISRKSTTGCDNIYMWWVGMRMGWVCAAVTRQRRCSIKYALTTSAPPYKQGLVVNYDVCVCVCTWGRQVWSSSMRRMPCGLEEMSSRQEWRFFSGTGYHWICSALYSSYRTHTHKRTFLRCSFFSRICHCSTGNIYYGVLKTH